MTQTPRKILITGVTASGKASLAFELAKKLDGEIISVDSMKVYKRMDIGTAKPSKERQSQVKYHLINVVEPSDSFSVDQFLEHFQKAEEDITRRNKTLIAVGGTALYIKTLMFGLFEGPGSDPEIRKKLRQRSQTEGLGNLHDELKLIDPESAERIHPNDAKRIIRALEVFQLSGKPISSFQTQFDRQPRQDFTVIGLRREKELENRRMNKRAKMMFEAGLVEEVKSLLAEPEPLSKQAAAAIGYAEVIDYLNCQQNLEETIELVKRNTRRFAKSQRTWFKTFRFINWLNIEETQTQNQITEKTLNFL